MAVTNPTISTARGKILFMVKETSRGVYNDAVYSAANAVFLNTPAIPSQPLRKVDSRQQRDSFSKFDRIPVGYGKGTIALDIYIKPSGSLGVRPHGHQVLQAWWGKETVVGATSVKYEPINPANAEVQPSYTMLVKYGHEVFLLVGAICVGGNIDGVADGSENVIAAWTGTFEFLRMYEIGKDELSGSEATAQTDISVKDASKFFYGFSTSPSVGMKVRFRTVAGVLDDNAGAGYTISNVNVGTNTITIAPGLAGAGLAANDVIEGFVPAPTDVGTPVGFHLGGVLHGVAGDQAWTIVGANVTKNNPFAKILEIEKTGLQWPNRIVDAGGNANLAELMAEIEFVETEDDTGLRYVARQQTRHILIMNWGDTAAKRFYIRFNSAELEEPSKTGDEEVHVTVAHQGLATGSGANEGYQMFD